MFNFVMQSWKIKLVWSNISLSPRGVVVISSNAIIFQSLRTNEINILHCHSSGYRKEVFVDNLRSKEIYIILRVLLTLKPQNSINLDYVSYTILVNKIKLFHSNP